MIGTFQSSTELEFDHATATGRERLIFLCGRDDTGREPEMTALIRRSESQVTRCRFADTSDLIRGVYASLVEVLEHRGALRLTPFDGDVCHDATLRDIDAGLVSAFVEKAEARGRLTLRGTRSTKAVLQNFHLLRDGLPTNAAILLFGKQPARFVTSAQVHCFHFFGVEKRKPIASQKPFDGTLFEVIDDAVEFMLSKLDHRVGTRAESTQAPVEPEIPRSVIAEAVVNAVAHRDYTSNGFVQVLVFADRIEVWNPGELPPGLTPELLRQPHGPIPRNPLIAEPLFRVQYAEKAGTGITDMISDCRAVGLREPTFRQCGPHFVTTIFRPLLKSMTEQVTEQVKRLLECLEKEMSREEIMAVLGLRHRPHFMREYLKPALEAGFVEMTLFDRPNSRFQKYRLTAKGRALRNR